MIKFLLIALVVCTSVLSSQILRIGLSSKILTLNPYFALDTESQQVCDIIYAGLIDLNNQLETIPQMAQTHTTQWLISEKSGSKVLTIPLRENIYWHDAKQFTAFANLQKFSSKDVARSFTILKNSPKIPYSRKVRDIMEINIRNTNVEVVYERGRFSYECLNFKLLPAFYFDRIMPPIDNSNCRFGQVVNNKALVSGTGYYKVRKWDTLAEKLLLEFTNNGLTDKKSFVTHIELNVNTDPEARINDLINGSIHLVLDLEPEYYQQISEPLEAIDYPSVYLAAIFFNYNPARANYNYIIDKNFRRALIHALDRRRIYQEVYSILGEYPRVTGPFLPGQGSYNDAVTPYPYDPDAAKLMLPERFRTERIRFELLVYDESQRRYNEAIANKIADDLQNTLNINVDVRLATNKEQYYQQIENSNFDMVLYEWASSVKPDISMWEKPAYQDGSPNNNNFSKYEYLGDGLIPDTTFYNDLSTIKYEREDNQKILEAYKRIHATLHDDVAALFLWNKKVYVAMNRAEQYGFGRRKLPYIKTNPVNFLKSIKDW